MGCCDSQPELLLSKKSKNKGDIHQITQKKKVSNPFQNQVSIRDFYDIVKTIGTGGFGTVFKVIDKKTGLERALKEILRTKLDPGSERQLIEEIEILKEMVIHK